MACLKLFKTSQNILTSGASFDIPLYTVNFYNSGMLTIFDPQTIFSKSEPVRAKNVKWCRNKITL